MSENGVCPLNTRSQTPHSISSAIDATSPAYLAPGFRTQSPNSDLLRSESRSGFQDDYDFRLPELPSGPSAPCTMTLQNPSCLSPATKPQPKLHPEHERPNSLSRSWQPTKTWMLEMAFIPGSSCGARPRVPFTNAHTIWVGIRCCPQECTQKALY